MDYEESVRQRRIENREALKSLGIIKMREDFATSVNSLKTKLTENSVKKASKVPKKRAISANASPSRRSARILGMEAPKYAEIEELEDQLPRMRMARTQKSQTPKPPLEKRENFFGAVPGVSVGTEYNTRMEVCHAGIHRPPVAGIHGNPALGCYSIALSGGYEDDVDNGESFIYTGEGGRDLKGTKVNPKNLRTAAQSKDQVLERGNLALSRNVENGLPVRVLRGYKLNSKYAPEEGYRYDGLYKVVDCYLATGKSGFGVYKFKFERLEDQEPAPWSEDFQVEESETNALELRAEAPFSPKGSISNSEMELDEGTSFSAEESVPNIEIQEIEGASLFNKGNASNGKIKQDDISSLDNVGIKEIN